jgi:ABC-type nitrate/sulfonate/bicarbonate transport system substrate-binding protein
VRADSPIKTIADLKGKTINVSSLASLTGWLGAQLWKRQGWNATDVKFTTVSPSTNAYALLKNGQIDAMFTDSTFAARLEREKQARVLIHMGDLIKDFPTHMIFASDTVLKDKPDAVRAFLAGWFETIHFMKTKKPETVKVLKDVLGADDAIANDAYDTLMSMFTDDGHFDPAQLKVLSKSLVEIGMLPTEPADMKKLYTEAFLPKNK